MTAAAIHGFEVQASPEIVHHWGWFLAFGIGLLALGRRCRHAFRHGYDCLDGVFRMAPCSGIRH